MVAVWADFEQAIVDNAINLWRRLRACVKAKGEHLEHLLWLAVCSSQSKAERGGTEFRHLSFWAE